MQDNGRANGRPEDFFMNSNRLPTSKGYEAMPARPFTVDEALPFSPLSSVVPFNSGTRYLQDNLYKWWSTSNIFLDIIPLPTIGLQASASLFTTTSEQQEARRGIEYLNQQYRSAGNSSDYFQEFIKDAQDLLDPNKLTKLQVHHGSL